MKLFGKKEKEVVEEKARKKKKAARGSVRHELRSSFKTTLRAGVDLREAVKVPPSQDKNEWIAMQMMELYNTMNLILPFTIDVCTDVTCPTMNASGGLKYLWADETIKKPIEVTAPQYIQHLLDWIDSKFDDPELFPLEGKFPKNFTSEIKVITKRMFRVYSHIFHAHHQYIKSVGSDAHVNTCFKHFYFFIDEFQLMDPADYEPMKPVIDRLK